MIEVDHFDWNDCKGVSVFIVSAYQYVEFQLDVHTTDVRYFFFFVKF